MDALNPAGEWLRITEHYRQMKDDELLLIARASSDLTEAAQTALTAEMRHRGLKLEPEEPPLQPIRKQFHEPVGDSSTEEEPDPYAEDRKLIGLRTVWSQRDALQMQTLLDRAGIPFFMGSEKATGVDEVTSDFSKGVNVQIMRVGWYWAELALKPYEPLDEPAVPAEKEWKEIPIRCPKCQSTEVVFEDLTGDPSKPDTQFQWTCDECGHQWNDDGVAKE